MHSFDFRSVYSSEPAFTIKQNDSQSSCYAQDSNSRFGIITV